MNVFGELLKEFDEEVDFDESYLLRIIGVHHNQVKLIKPELKHPREICLVYDLSRQIYQGFGGYMNSENEAVNFVGTTFTASNGIEDIEYTITQMLITEISVTCGGENLRYTLKEHITKTEQIDLWYGLV